MLYKMCRNTSPGEGGKRIDHETVQIDKTYTYCRGTILVEKFIQPPLTCLQAEPIIQMKTLSHTHTYFLFNALIHHVYLVDK
jgi:hypothetical protein